MQLLRTAGGLLLQREIPEEVNAQAAQVQTCTWRHAANPDGSPLHYETWKYYQSTSKVCETTESHSELQLLELLLSWTSSSKVFCDPARMEKSRVIVGHHQALCTQAATR